jgi:hypothetical protein
MGVRFTIRSSKDQNPILEGGPLSRYPFSGPADTDMVKVRRMLPLYLVALGALLILGGCREIPTSLNVGNGPSFTLRGNGQLASFRIYGPLPGRRIATPFDSKSLVWRIQPADGYFKGAVVELLRIEYGRVPSGYEQVIPRNGIALALPAGEVYYFFAETTNAPQPPVGST